MNYKIAKIVESIKRAEAAELKATRMLEELLPLGTRVKVRVASVFFATIAAHTSPICDSVCVRPENPGDLDPVWKAIADRLHGSLEGCVNVPVSSLEIACPRPPTSANNCSKPGSFTTA